MSKTHFLNDFTHPLCGASTTTNPLKVTTIPSKVTCLTCLKIMDAPGDPWGIHERFKQLQEAD